MRLRKIASLGLGVLALTATPASAGREGSGAGNGGGAVGCWMHDGSLQVRLHDYFEGAMERGETPDLGPASLSLMEKVNRVLGRLDSIDPGLESSLKADAAAFLKSSVFLKNVALPKIPDTGPILLPDNCDYRQLVIQKAPRFHGDQRYTINGGLWNQLSPDDQAGTVLHEVAYKYFISRGDETSERTRHFNSLISSKKFEQLPLSERISAWHDLGLQVGGVTDNGFSFAGDSMQFFDNGAVKSGSVGYSEVTLSGTKIIVEGMVTFYESGKIQSVSWAKALDPESQYEPYHVRFPIGGKQIAFETDSFGDQPLVFFETGVLKSGSLVVPVTFTVGGTQAELTSGIGGPAMEFHENGAPAAGILLNSTRFHFQDGDFLFCGSLSDAMPRGTTMGATGFAVAFSPQGQILRGLLCEDALLTKTDGTRQKYPAGSQLVINEFGKVISGTQVVFNMNSSVPPQKGIVGLRLIDLAGTYQLTNCTSPSPVWYGKLSIDRDSRGYTFDTNYGIMPLSQGSGHFGLTDEEGTQRSCSEDSKSMPGLTYEYCQQISKGTKDYVLSIDYSDENSAEGLPGWFIKTDTTHRRISLFYDKNGALWSHYERHDSGDHLATPKVDENLYCRLRK